MCIVQIPFAAVQLQGLTLHVHVQTYLRSKHLVIKHMDYYSLSCKIMEIRRLPRLTAYAVKFFYFLTICTFFTHK